jgi:hypothetical protein
MPKHPRALSWRACVEATPLSALRRPRPATNTDIRPLGMWWIGPQTRPRTVGPPPGYYWALGPLDMSWHMYFGVFEHVALMCSSKRICTDASSKEGTQPGETGESR